MTPLVLPAGVPSQVRVWLVDVMRDEVRLDGLDAAERARCLHYRQHESRLRFSETRLALRTLLGGRLGMAPDAVPLAAGAHGKPQLAGGALQFNVTHCGQYALVAISDAAPVGIDLERIDRARPFADMAAAYYSAAEQAACRDDPEAFFQLWSCKEALVKAWGTGIGGGLPALAAEGGQWQAAPNGAATAPGRVWRIAAPHGYVAALAIA